MLIETSGYEDAVAPIFPTDIFTEPPDVDPDTLANLGPLRRLGSTPGHRRQSESRRARRRVYIVFNPDGSWSHVTDTTLTVHGRSTPFAHRDQNTLVKVSEPLPNPLARIAAAKARGNTA